MLELSTSDSEALHSLLDGDGCMDVPETLGAIVALHSAQTDTPRSVWEPIVLGSKALHADDSSREALLRLHERVGHKLQREGMLLPKDSEVRSFLRGYMRMADLREHHDEQSLPLSLLRALAENQAPPDYEDDFCDTPEEWLENARGGVPEALDDIYLANHGRLPNEVQARSTKADRNAPCPCGSGRKYKKCCGAS